MVIVGLFTATMLSGNRPVLGLDLQGGISIVLFPVEGTDLARSTPRSTSSATASTALGIAEPDVQRQGDTIVVDLPGVKDRTKAQSIVGETAELRFRPVECQGSNPLVIPWTATSARPPPVPEPRRPAPVRPRRPTAAVSGSDHHETGGETSTSGQAAGRTIDTEPIVREVRPERDDDCAGATSTTAAAHVDDQARLGRPRRLHRRRDRRRARPLIKDGRARHRRRRRRSSCPIASARRRATSSAPTRRHRPKSVGSASAQYDPHTSQWVVDVKFKNDDFVNKVAVPYVNKLVAIELDGVVQSAPEINPGITGQRRPDHR